jgi:ESCRT-I complex subunit VPS28
MRLYDSAEERSRFDDLATFYSIIRAIELLESSFTKDLVAQEEYADGCYKLMQQYKTQESALLRSGAITSVDSFLKEYGFSCTMALERIRVGAPATAVISNPGQASQSQFVVMEVVQFMLTCMDALKLAQGSGAAVDDILPLLRDVVGSLNKLPNLPAGFSGKTKPMEWMVKLNGMRASQLLDDDQMRQMYLDLEDSYKQLHELLRSQ